MTLLTIVILTGILAFCLSTIGAKGLAVIEKSSERKWKK
tara:strand:+ start:611 stop:727 length:117 start_codon:yes stop_codon:yes gene_type:complete